MDGYGVMGIFYFPYMPSCELYLGKQLVGDLLNLVAYRLHCKHYFCHLTRPPSYRQFSFHISTLGRYLKNAGKVGWVGIRLASVYTASLSYYHMFKNPYHLHYSDCAGSWCSEQYGDSFINTWAVEVAA